MSDNTKLIAEAKNYEGDNGSARWPSLIRDLAAALDQAERELAEAKAVAFDAIQDDQIIRRKLTTMRQDLTDLCTAFRDYKIVHPEGTR